MTFYDDLELAFGALNMSNVHAGAQNESLLIGERSNCR